MKLAGRIPEISSKLEARLVAEYGAIFVTVGVPPPKIIFAGEAEVQAFQDSLDKAKGVFGSYEIELQSKAMGALESAAAQALAMGKSISPRSADSARRSYQETLALWERNVSRGLDHWLSRGRLTVEQTETIRSLAIPGQVEAVLQLEESQQIFFSTYFDKSILQSVAAPGASQHLSMLAFDVAEFNDSSAEALMASNGWYRTVLSDLPHFTYLGHQESALSGLGLEQVVRESDGSAYHFWVPNASSPDGYHPAAAFGNHAPSV
jgi:hypothetical protein